MIKGKHLVDYLHPVLLTKDNYAQELRKLFRKFCVDYPFESAVYDVEKHVKFNRNVYVFLQYNKDKKNFIFTYTINLQHNWMLTYEGRYTTDLKDNIFTIC